MAATSPGPEPIPTALATPLADPRRRRASPPERRLELSPVRGTGFKTRSLIGGRSGLLCGEFGRFVHRDDNIPLLVSSFDVPMRLGYLSHGIAAIDGRFECARLSKPTEVAEIFGLLAG